MTIIAVYNSRGCVGRCDAKCHNATKPDCRCICGGAFHGIATTPTQEEREAITDDEIIAAAQKIFGEDHYRVARCTEQMELFA